MIFCHISDSAFDLAALVFVGILLKHQGTLCLIMWNTLPGLLVTFQAWPHVVLYIALIQRYFRTFFDKFIFGQFFDVFAKICSALFLFGCPPPWIYNFSFKIFEV